MGAPLLVRRRLAAAVPLQLLVLLAAGALVSAAGGGATAKRGNNGIELPLADDLVEASGGTKFRQPPRFHVRGPWEVLGNRVEIASSDCPATPNMGCSSEVLTAFWEKATPFQQALLLQALNKDATPRPVNLNVTRDGPTFQCRLTAKYKAIGADAVRFVNSELTNIALVKAGRNVLISYRCSFNLAQDDNSMTEWPAHTTRIGGRAHGGWLRSALQSWPKVEQVLRDDFGCRGANCRLYLTGHSRGGPLSTIAATLVNTSLATVGGVHTFGSCRVGDGNFQRLYNARLGNVTYNWWNRQDWVPMQPWIYAQSPRLRLTDSQCPDVTKRTFSNCFIERRANATHGAGAGAGAGAGGAHEEKLCSYSTRSLLGARLHRERPYLSALLQCARPMSIGDKCVAAIMQL